MAVNTDRATTLNTHWDALMGLYDQYYKSLSPAVQTTLRAAVSNWQDFYFGSEVYPEELLIVQEAVYSKAAQTLNAAIAGGARVGVVTNATGKAKASASSPVFSIAGKSSFDPSKLDFALPRWWWFALGGLPALAILYFTRNRG